MHFDEEELEGYKESNTLTHEQYQDFLIEVEKQPSARSPLSGQEARLCCEFMEDTLLRVSETLAVRKKDIDFKTRILIVINPKVHQKCKCSRWKNKNQYSNVKILEYADPTCQKCHGKGKWKKPQRTTITPRIYNKLYEYCKGLEPEDRLFPTSRQSIYNWVIAASEAADIKIFQQKEERVIKGIFVHFFRELGSKRTKADAKNDEFRDELVQAKRRDSYDKMVDRYTKVDINYLLNWEDVTYKVSA